MVFFTFEPGDGVKYHVVFGRVPSPAPPIPSYTVFGIAEDGMSAGDWYAFETDQVSFDVFSEHLCSNHELVYWRLWLAAWRLWLALTGQPDDEEAAVRHELRPWREDWRQQLPASP